MISTCCMTLGFELGSCVCLLCSQRYPTGPRTKAQCKGTHPLLSRIEFFIKGLSVSVLSATLVGSMCVAAKRSGSHSHLPLNFNIATYTQIPAVDT
jgi:hypothetical protein